MTHQLWATLKGFHHKGPSPILVLTVHSSPVPLSPSWDGTPSWPLVVSWEVNPQSAGHHETRGQVPGESVAGDPSTDSKVQFMCSIMFTSIF